MSKADEEQEELEIFYRKLKDDINCQLPAIIQAVNDDGTVDCLVIRHDEEKDVTFPNIRVKHLETQRAFIFLGLEKGDRGVVRFFDRSIESYKIDGNQEYNGDPRQHSLSDCNFELGFVPNSENYAFPKDKTVAVGNKNGTFLLTIGKDGQLICTAAGYEFTGPVKFNDNATFAKDMEIGGKVHSAGEISSDTDVKAAGKSGVSHTHKSATPGVSTSPPE